MMVPFIPWKKVYNNLWGKFELYLPGPVEEFNTLLRKKWPLMQTRHLFFVSAILIGIVTAVYFLGTFLNLSTLPLPLGVTIAILLPFIGVYLLKPNIEAGFLFEVRLIYTVLRTQITAGAGPQEAISLAIDTAEILKKDLQDILFAWGGNIDLTLKAIADKYNTDELNILLSLIREINHAGASDQKEVLESFENMREMMEDEITAQEVKNDEKEMEMLELSSFGFIFALFFLMIIPIVDDVINTFNQI